MHARERVAKKPAASRRGQTRSSKLPRICLRSFVTFYLLRPLHIIMSAAPISEKPSTRPLPAYLAPVSPLVGVYNRFNYWRTALELPNPGSAENLQKEVKSACRMHLTATHRCELSTLPAQTRT